MCDLLPEAASATKQIDTRGYPASTVKVSLQGAGKVLFGVWVILLLPWLMMVPLTVMAFDGGSAVLVYTFLFCFWTYPLAVVIVAIFTKKFPLIALLPCLHIALFVYFD